MRVLIAGDAFGFPNGTGASARVRSYATGITACGSAAYIAALQPEAESARKNHLASGVWQGIEYEYVAGTTSAAPTFAGRRIQDLRSAYRLALLVFGTRGAPRPDATILFSNSLRWIVVARLATWLTGSPLFLEKSEYPFVYNPPETPCGRFYQRWYQRYVFRVFDGAVVISTLLADYFLEALRPGAAVIRVPILVDHSSFAAPRGAPEDVVMYVGNLSHIGEVESLFAAFLPLASSHPTTHVAIVGDGQPSRVAGLASHADSLGISDRVNFLGHVDARAVPALLGSARVLALPRAAGTYSHAGFPTKLGEYLASGRPVVVTATGDIPLYLTDGFDSYLVPPDDTSAFSTGLRRALDDSDSARVGLHGREIALREFDPVTHMRALLDIITRVLARRAPDDSLN